MNNMFVAVNLDTGVTISQYLVGNRISQQVDDKTPDETVCCCESCAQQRFNTRLGMYKAGRFLVLSSHKPTPDHATCKSLTLLAADELKDVPKSTDKATPAKKVILLADMHTSLGLLKKGTSYSYNGMKDGIHFLTINEFFSMQLADQSYREYFVAKEAPAAKERAPEKTTEKTSLNIYSLKYNHLMTRGYKPVGDVLVKTGVYTQVIDLKNLDECKVYFGEKLVKIITMDWNA